MALYLVQHGRSLPRGEDPEEGLSEEGRADAVRIASLAGSHGVRVSLIKHSGRKRARETAEIMADALTPVAGMVEDPGLGPLDDVSAFSVGLDAEDDLMVVGHLPFLSRLTSLLVTGSPDTPIFEFQNGGIVCLDRRPGPWIIKWAIVPRIG
jgi:phosphohistidine phosphatase